MSKVVEGYVLDIDTAAGIPGVPVTVYDANTNSPLSGVVGLTSNPVNTNSNGHFKITMDLSPGPIYADAENGSKHDRRYGLEQMQIGDHWMSDIPTLLHLFSDGVIRGVANELAVSVSGSLNQFTVATGEAIVQGYAWSLASGAYTASIAANTTLPNRRSIVVLRQYLDAAYQGKQEIGIVYGVADATDPVLKQGVDDGSGNTIWEFPLATLNTAQNAGVSTIYQDDRVFTQPSGTSVARLAPELFDDFRGGGPNLAWASATTSGGIISSVVNPGVNHPGIAILQTGSTNGSLVTIYQRDYYEQITQTIEWIFRLPASTSETFTIGLFSPVAPLDGVGVEYDTAQSDTNLVLAKYVAGTRTTLDTVPLDVTHWYRLLWTRTGSGTGILTVTDIDAATTKIKSVSGLTAGADWAALATITARSNSQRSAYLDWFRATTSGIVR